MSQALADLVGQSSLAHLQALTSGTWEGTDVLVAQIVNESRHSQGWRPVRAAGMLALADQRATDRVWMTTEEFTAWWNNAKALAKRMRWSTTHAQTDLEMAPSRMIQLKNPAKVAEKNLRVSKVEALACAHYALVLPKPVANGDHQALAAWFESRFLAVGRVAAYLDMRTETLTARLKGWDLIRGERVPRPPEGSLIRALDWIHRMGPVCPYGERPPALVFPKQDVVG